MKGTTVKKIFSALGFLGCIVAANYVTTRYGLVPVGFGVMATAGTYFAGLSFVLRDSLQDAVRASLPNRSVIVQRQYPLKAPGGNTVHHVSAGFYTAVLPPKDSAVALRVVAVIILGSVLSFAVSDHSLALASAAAFLISESLDFAVYTPLRRGGYVRAAVASNIVGAVVDTAVFLWLATPFFSKVIPGFNPWDQVPGQLIGKLTVTLGVVAVIGLARLALRTRATT